MAVYTPTLTAFSSGYWGWGNATPELVRGIDAAEARAGFAPPLFIDVRFSRSVRAVGFNGNAFGKLLGAKRYVWMRALGNKQIGEREGPRMAISDPSAAFDLLEHVRAAASQRQRLLFFCSCEHARDDAGTQCHRTEVARLLRAAAADQGNALETVEWPGGEPQDLEVHTTPALLSAIARDRVTLPLTGRSDLARVAGLPWGSLVRARGDEQSVLFVSGPAKFVGGSWCLPVLKAFANATADNRDAKQWGADLRAQRMLEPSSGPPCSVAGALASKCVYTIAHVDKLDAIAKASGGGTLTEGRAWVTAKKFLDLARTDGLQLPIVFADADDCSRLLYWGLLTRIETSTKGTSYAFEGLRRLGGTHAPQELTLVGTGRKIAAGFIRPYALCVTPAWMRGTKPNTAPSSNPHLLSSRQLLDPTLGLERAGECILHDKHILLVARLAGRDEVREQRHRSSGRSPTHRPRYLSCEAAVLQIDPAVVGIPRGLGQPAHGKRSSGCLIVALKEPQLPSTWVAYHAQGFTKRLNSRRY